MDLFPEWVTVADVERRFLADWRWWATRIGMAAFGGMFVFCAGFFVNEGVSSALVSAAFSTLFLITLIFRRDYLFFGCTYKIGGRFDLGEGMQYWVEQEGKRPAHEGSVVVLVRVGGIFRPRRSITVSDGSDKDGPFGRGIDYDDDGFVVSRRRSGTGRAKHIEGLMRILIEDTRPLRRGPSAMT